MLFISLPIPPRKHTPPNDKGRNHPNHKNNKKRLRFCEKRTPPVATCRGGKGVVYALSFRFYQSDGNKIASLWLYPIAMES